MKNRLTMLAISAALYMLAAPFSAHAELQQAKQALADFHNQPRYDLPMYITHTAWSLDDELGFGDFVYKLGRAISRRQCNTVKSCLQNPIANEYANLDPKGLVLYSDCADFPFFLRSYYAYHNGLPFSYVTGVRKNLFPYASENDLADVVALKDESNSPYGNSITSRGGANTAPAPGYEPNYLDYISRMYDIVFTGTFRVSPLSPTHSLSDLYPVKLDRYGVGKGTVVHATGHALIVWNVTPDGTAQAIDAHPDGSVQFKNIEPAILGRSRPDQGLGFYRYRPLMLVGAQRASNGAYYGGRVVTADDQSLINVGVYSMEQWFGPGSSVGPGSKVDPNAWKKAFSQISFYDYLARGLRGDNVILQADEQLSFKFKSICNEMVTRVSTVEKAIQAGAPMTQHPASLPTDIFGEADPTWGALSSPGGDNRLREEIGDILKSAVAMFRQAKAGDKTIKFDGSAEDFAAALQKSYAAASDSCAIKYKNSAGASVRLTLNQALARANKWSFDPYHCAERRWGATGSELATCRDTDKNGVWYDAEQNIRNTVGKTTASDIAIVRSDRPITLSMLQTPAYVDRPDSSMIALGTSTAPIMDMGAYLASPNFIERLTK